MAIFSKREQCAVGLFGGFFIDGVGGSLVLDGQDLVKMQIVRDVQCHLVFARLTWIFVFRFVRWMCSDSIILRRCSGTHEFVEPCGDDSWGSLKRGKVRIRLANYSAQVGFLTSKFSRI